MKSLRAAAAVITDSSSAPGQPHSCFRWVICALLFFAVTINYVDRQIISLLQPLLQARFGWTQIDYANIVTAFQAAYALGQLLLGWALERMGLRAGFALAVGLWSLFAAAHGLLAWLPAGAQYRIGGHLFGYTALSVLGFGLVRFGLGLAEGGCFPGAIKAVADWFPRKERALATGIFNSGSNVGALVTPILVPWLAAQWGWQTAFFVTGAAGLVWICAWSWLYADPETHPRVTPQELAHIRSGPAEPAARIPWLGLWRLRATWAFSIAMFLVAPVWWFYLFWIPPFLHDRHGVQVTVAQMGLPVLTIYLLASAGSVTGGWISSRFLKRGWPVGAARKTAMLACAVCVLPIVFAAHAPGPWTAVALIGLAAAAHQGFAANLYTIVSDTLPPPAVSSVIGIGGMAGGIGGMFVATLVGRILFWTHNNYLAPFLFAACAYLAALGAIHLLLPKPGPATRLAPGA